METVALVVLDDGETYSDMDGCRIVIVSKDIAIGLETGELDIREIPVVFEIELKGYVGMIPDA